jgi:hypothetical protein
MRLVEEVLIPQTTGHVGVRLYNAERSPNGELDYFSVELFDPTLRANARVYAYASASLPELFDEMAAQWRGWSEAKRWKSLEGELELSFTVDRMGHVAVSVRLAESLYPDSWRVQATALVEAGQLESLAKSVRNFFEKAGRAA